MRQHESIAIPLASGETLRGDLRFDGSPREAAIVFIHGFAGHRNGDKSLALEAACAQSGISFVAFDCRGHGESDGLMRDLRGTRLLEDLAAVRDGLAARGINKLGLVGSSMGGFAAAWFAIRSVEVKACVLMAPAFRFLERRWKALSELEHQFWKGAGHVRYKNEFVDVEVGYGLVEEWELFPFEQLTAQWTKPLLIFHGLADDTVPAGDSIEFQQNAAGPQIELRLFKNGDHRLTAFKDEMAVETCRFFTKWF
jgi:uncharacterized protein